MEKYIPISCNYYDHLEALATLGKKVQIQFLDNLEKETTIEDKIVDFQIIQKVEYLILAEGTAIRLDRLISVDQILLSDFKSC
jgi:Rho-binding antiterminator